MPPSDATVVPWDGRTLEPWAGQLEGALAVINMAGRSVNCRYTRRNKREMLASRVDTTRVLGEAIARCKRPPAVWLNSSTATIYQHLDRPMDEPTGIIAATTAAKDAFSIEIATAWEAELLPRPHRTRAWARHCCRSRESSGQYADDSAAAGANGAGRAMGNGRQYVSWIHALDFCRAMQFLLVGDELSGAVNLAAPNPLTNAEMMRILRAQFWPAIRLAEAPRVMLEVGAFFMRTETELIIKSRQVIPTRLSAGGVHLSFHVFRPPSKISLQHKHVRQCNLLLLCHKQHRSREVETRAVGPYINPHCTFPERRSE